MNEKYEKFVYDVDSYLIDFYINWNFEKWMEFVNKCVILIKEKKTTALRSEERKEVLKR
tara:strand:+ start:102 stop:278 length:177 start_codon:yes stop_codon:yes gene_type:complete